MSTRDLIHFQCCQDKVSDYQFLPPLTTEGITITIFIFANLLDKKKCISPLSTE